ncbi:hypothetical protein LPTSP2_33120 [Leptospira ellinghausenii]|uniref:Uncharacterized protein n=1 Tax=Leptospira ellinghausenii TaxID=1917822 RepID=A0A2P2DHD4_9LEPT|nr:DUF6428 family protein [Leptospira ellinghausenii]GBF44009.1 hypothetical protein LPTSP2_33120 [Leptospira ellinghausenii]
MNQSMTWLNFKKNLDLYPELQLTFLYQNQERIYPNYHITEFKLATIESVDCGGNYDTWKEIILQVLEPNEKIETGSMDLKKVNSIFTKVSTRILIPDDAILRIEFGNSKSAMRQYFVSNLQIVGTELVMELVDGKTECKASESCGIKKDTNIPILNEEFVSEKPISKNSCCSKKPSEVSLEKVGCC